ncbi:thiol reductant ABC exporter subunit CydD [Alkalibacillus salilacus]|uniref:ATP-binding cassette subfamily C protein CydD n=1 Tax=Alkalibacillus salilacus TaxID=284582 RepID=A0ABT9VH00_9BACI|nr:thiol reductant ABC exporter subunit CydD [Alkalibacillus salilacus]MDQ0160240.1 ATP-binding cassette subfamily C protein CydD [Alkalibacillus salilacus]
MSLLKSYVSRISLIQLISVHLLSATMIVLQAFLIVYIINSIFLNNASFLDVVFYLIGLIMVMSLRALLTYTSGHIGISLAKNAKAKLRMQLIHHYTKQPIELASQGRSGSKVSTLLNVVDQTDAYYREYLPQMVRASIVPLTILIIMFTQNWVSGVIVLVTAPFIPIFMAIIGLKTRDKSEEQLNALSNFSGQFLDSVQGLTTLSLFGRAHNEQDLIEKRSDQFRDATLGVLKVAFTSAFMMELISMLSIGLIALELAVGLIIFDSILFTTAFFVLLLAPEFYIALKDLSSAFHSGRESITAGKKLEDALNEQAESINWGDQTIVSVPPRITFSHVTFAYHSEPTLNNISTTIEPGDNVAIVGPSGAGKTTFLHVLAGLLPVHNGTIFINNLKQYDLREDVWFQQLSYITQSPHVFAGSIYDNIAISKPNANFDDVQQAADLAKLTPLINSLENGLETVVGEGGRGLSGGEKQRLALARAFLKQPSLILFDEPTTGLDLETERTLNHAISTLSENATVITVAHRIHTIQSADKILVMENGELTAEGTDEMLKQSSETYRALLDRRGGVNA